jgi:hypothetical protein
LMKFHGNHDPNMDFFYIYLQNFEKQR